MSRSGGWAAAAAALRVDAKNPVAEAVLNHAVHGDSDEIAELARAVLLADRVQDTRRIEIEQPSGSAEGTADAALVHGTWARNGRWWQPGAAFHRYLKSDAALFPNLYVGRRAFKWSGYFEFRRLVKG